MRVYSRGKSALRKSRAQPESPALSQEGAAAMLVLSRQRDQSVIIGRQVEVKVVDIRGDKVRLGFVAPHEVEVDRKEVFEQKQARLNAAPATVTPQERQAMDPFLPAADDLAGADQHRSDRQPALR